MKHIQAQRRTCINPLSHSPTVTLHVSDSGIRMQVLIADISETGGLFKWFRQLCLIWFTSPLCLSSQQFSTALFSSDGRRWGNHCAEQLCCWWKHRSLLYIWSFRRCIAPIAEDNAPYPIHQKTILQTRIQQYPTKWLF